VNFATQEFINLMNTTLADNTYTQTIKLTNDNNKNKPWYNDVIKNAIFKKNKIRQIVLQNPKNTKLITIYKIFRNKITALIRLTKNKFYRKKIEDSKTNPKQLWKTINNIIERNKERNQKLPIGNSTLDIANKMNDYFSKIGAEINNNFTSVGGDNANFCNTTNEDEINILTPVNEIEVKTIIGNLKNTKTKGIDNIEVQFLKLHSKYLIEPIKYLINNSFNTMTFPDVLKRTIIIPIFKGGNQNEICNYRPIAITSALSKIIENAFLKRLENYLEMKNIINPQQFGFRKKIGTEEAIAAVIKEIYTNINDNKKTAATTIDISKAFDCVSHEILLKKIKNLGMDNIPLTG